MNRPMSAVLVIGAMLFSIAQLTMAVGLAGKAGEIPTVVGDLVVGEGETRTIENERFILEGDITVKSGGTLIVRNSNITVNSHYKNQYWVRISSNATLLVEDSVLREGPVPDLAHCESFGGVEDFRFGETVIQPRGDNSHVILRNSTSELRLGPDPGSTIILDSSYLSILFWRPLQSVRTVVTNSSIQMVHIWLRGEDEEDIELSGLGGGGNQNVHLSVEGAALDINESWVGRYSLALWMVYEENDCRKNLTVRDSTLSEIFAVFPVGSDVKLWNMVPRYFENWSIHDSIDGSGVPWNLSLINTTLHKWKLDFHGVAEIENSRFHLDTWGEARVTVRNSTIVSNHHTRGGHVRFINTVISDSFDHPTGVRFLHQPDVTGIYRPSYVYEFENSVIGPYAELEITNDNIHCTFKGELSVLVPPEDVHWFGGTVEREYTVLVTDENGAPLAGVPVVLLSPDNVQLWSGTTEVDGKTSFILKFGRENYRESFMLQAAIDDENIWSEVGFLTSTPILLSKMIHSQGIPIVPSVGIVIIVSAILCFVLVIWRWWYGKKST